MEARAAIEHTGARIAALKEGLEAARLQIAAAAAARAILFDPLKTVLESLNGDRPKVDPEILANVMRAPAELRPALGAVLGDNLEAVIVDSPYFAARAIEILKEKNGGRLSFIPEPELSVDAHEPIQAPGIAGRLIDLIGVDPRYQNVVELMLGHVMLADDVRSALHASNLNGHGTLFVTRDGDLVSPGQIIRGGSANRSDTAIDAPPVKPLHEIEAELSRAEIEHENSQARFARYTAIRAEIAASLAQVRARAHEAERAAIAARAEAASSEQKSRMAYVQLEAARKRLAEIRDLAIVTNARLEELARLEQSSRAQLATMREEIANRRAGLEELGAVMLDAASRVEARRSQILALEQEFRHALGGNSRPRNSNRRELGAADSRRRRTRRVRERAGQAFRADEEARLREAELSESIARLEIECAQLVADLESRRAEYKNAQAALHTIETEAVDCALKCERARTLIEELLRNFIEKFAVEFDFVAGEVAAAIATRDGMADDQRIAELRAKAERIGEVNLAAESEVKELEERASKLQAERADLDAAVKDLSRPLSSSIARRVNASPKLSKAPRKTSKNYFPSCCRAAAGRLELEQSRRCPRSRRQHPGAARGQESQRNWIALGRRESALRDGAYLLAVPFESQPVLRDGRSRCAPRRVPPQRIYEFDCRAQGALAIHHHHAQSAHYAARRSHSRRDDGSPGHLENYLIENPASRVVIFRATRAAPSTRCDFRTDHRHKRDRNLPAARPRRLDGRRA